MKRFLLFFSFTICSNIWAQLNTDRPSLSDNSYTLKKGTFQNENGFQINAIPNLESSNSNPFNINYTGVLPYSSFRYGAHKRLEIRAATAILSDPKFAQANYGLSDLELGIKFQLLEHIAWISHIGIPNGTTNFSSKRTYWNNKISATLPIGQTSIITNLGFTSFEKFNSNTQRNWLTTLVVSRNINDHAFIFLEGFNQVLQINNEAFRNLGLDFGFAVKPHNRIQLDLSYGYTTNQQFVNLGFSWGAFQNTPSNFRKTITPDF